MDPISWDCWAALICSIFPSMLSGDSPCVFIAKAGKLLDAIMLPPNLAPAVLALALDSREI